MQLNMDRKICKAEAKNNINISNENNIVRNCGLSPSKLMYDILFCTCTILHFCT